MSIHWKDKTRLLKSIGFRKGFNILRLYVSYINSRLLGKSRMSRMPMGLSIEPTTSCNLRCSECPSGLRSFTRPTGMLTEGTFEKIINELKSSLIWLTFYFQGEPYLNPEFLEMVKYATDRRIYTMTSTNAHYITKEMAEKTVKSGLSRIIISMDGLSQETYEKYRKGGSVDKVKEGINNLVAAKKKLKSSTPHIILQFIVFKHNEHEVGDIRKYGHQVGVDEVKIKSAQIYDFSNTDLLPSNEEYSRYANSDGTFKIKEDLQNHCWRMWSSAVITWDGKVVPCCFDKDATYQMGTIKDESFRNIWLSESYNEFRNRVLLNRNDIDICTNCTEGTKVWI